MRFKATFEQEGLSSLQMGFLPALEKIGKTCDLVLSPQDIYFVLQGKEGEVDNTGAVLRFNRVRPRSLPWRWLGRSDLGRFSSPSGPSLQGRQLCVHEQERKLHCLLLPALPHVQGGRRPVRQRFCFNDRTVAKRQVIRAADTLQAETVDVKLTTKPVPGDPSEARRPYLSFHFKVTTPVFFLARSCPCFWDQFPRACMRGVVVPLCSIAAARSRPVSRGSSR